MADNSIEDIEGDLIVPTCIALGAKSILVSLVWIGLTQGTFSTSSVLSLENTNSFVLEADSCSWNFSQ